MIEIRLDGSPITVSSDIQDAFITTFDYLLGREDRSLAPLYKKYADYDFEDLVEELCDLASDKELEPEIVFLVRAGQNIRFSSAILPNRSGQ